MSGIAPGVVINNRYALERQIGAGGMATVWLADDRLLGRKVAVKILSDRYASDPGFVERFRREASAAASLSHQNIVTVYDRGEAAGSYYIVMEHLPGPDLKAIIRQHGRLEPRHSVDAALQILAALSAAHRRDLIHRDIKPQNVLVSHDGHLKVTDFGIARAGDEADVTEAGSVIGTAQYLSPEQARGADVTTASDCYSVGVVLYEMLTGRVPFDGDKPVAIAMRQVHEPPIAPKLIVPTIPDDLNAIVMKALEKRPSNRYRTAEEFTQALLAIRPSLGAPAQTTQVLPAVAVEQRTEVLNPSAPAPVPTAHARGERATRTVMQTGRPTPPPPDPTPKRRRLWAAAIIAALVVATGLGLALFTDIGRAGIAVPSVSGLTPDAAKLALIEQGLKVSSETETRADPTIATGFVIGTDPPQGSTVKKGALIRLIVSSGPKLLVVPDVRGKTRKVAAEMLQADGFKSKFTEQFSADVDKGLVSDQTPLGGESLAEGGTVNVVISKGADLVKVPNLKLMTQSQAEAALKDAGLKRGTVTTRVTTQRDPGTVLDLSPGAGKMVPRGSSVDIVVAAAPATIAMPKLIGLTHTEANAKLAQLGLSATSSEQESTEPAGTVIGQDPPVGRQIDPTNVAINIVVSTGPPPTTSTP